jgi:hypothetical protein
MSEETPSRLSTPKVSTIQPAQEHPVTALPPVWFAHHRETVGQKQFNRFRMSGAVPDRMVP